jgi:diguanylate cyclase (GGDEF)-like protein
VLHAEGGLGFQLRDRQGASRFVAYLMFVGSPFVLLTAVILAPQHSLAIHLAATVISVAIGIGAWVCWSRPHVLPDFFWLAAPIMATTIITGLNLMTHDATTGSQLFYLWPVLYAANFLSRRMIYLNLVILLTGEALVVTTVLGPANALSDWAAMAVAMTMTAIIVASLRERGDRLMRRLESQALADPLTGLANRRSFDDNLRAATAWAQQTGHPIALVTVDLDHFKTINDTYGHAAGDLALQAVAGALQSVAGPDDVVARLGGDEFVMLLRADKPAALRATDLMRDLVAGLTGLPSGAPGLSIGVAVLPDDAHTVERLIAASDAALYDAKGRGRGQVAVANGRTGGVIRHNADGVPVPESALRA